MLNYDRSYFYIISNDDSCLHYEFFGCVDTMSRNARRFLDIYYNMSYKF